MPTTTTNDDLLFDLDLRFVLTDERETPTGDPDPPIRRLPSPGAACSAGTCLTNYTCRRPNCWH